MAKRGKNYTESLKLIDKEKYYEGREVDVRGGHRGLQRVGAHAGLIGDLLQLRLVRLELGGLDDLPVRRHEETEAAGIGGNGGNTAVALSNFGKQIVIATTNYDVYLEDELNLISAITRIGDDSSKIDSGCDFEIMGVEGLPKSESIWGAALLSSARSSHSFLVSYKSQRDRKSVV